MKLNIDEQNRKQKKQTPTPGSFKDLFLKEFLDQR